MEKHYFENEKFDQVDFSLQALAPGVYEQCEFIGCKLAGVNLSGIRFAECSFTDCDLTLAMLGDTAFQQVKFTGCKMLGMHFDHCRELSFEVAFNNCVLNHSCFSRRRLKNTPFLNCTLQEVDFSEADLSAAIFEQCDLTGAFFEQTKLEKADLRSSWNFTIDPALNNIKKARFSLTGLPGLLTKYNLEIV